jgi:hypothetical protein
MSKKHFSWLAGITILAAVIAFLVPSQTSQDNSFEATPLLPELEKRVNEIDWLQISAEGSTIATVVRTEGRWAVEEASGYHADWPTIHGLLSALAGAEVIEPKTSNPDYYDRLGVEDTGVLVAFASSPPIPAVIVGRSAQGREGQYVRLKDSSRSVLIDRVLDVPRNTEDWLDREIVDISEDEVVEVSVTQAGGEAVLARKISADDEDFDLQNIPQGSEPKTSWAVNSLAGGLASLELDAVVPQDNIDWSAATQYRLVTADGLDMRAELTTVPGEGEDEVSYWLRLEAGLYTTAIGGVVDEGETAARAEAINQRVTGWAYQVSKYTFDAMNKRMDDLVREKESKE